MMPCEELAGKGSHIEFSSKDGKASLKLPAIVAVYVARAANVVKVVYELEELYMVAMQSFCGFSGEVLSLADLARYSLRCQEEDHFRDCLKINRSLASLFTVLRMYSDTVRGLFVDSKKKVEELFELPGYKELDALRNYVQHVSFLPFRRNLSYTICDPAVALSCCRFEIENDKIQLESVESKKTKAKLEELLRQDHIDIYELVMDGMAVFRQIHRIVRLTKCFTADYDLCGQFLHQMHASVVGSGLSEFKLRNGEVVLCEGKSHFYLSMMSMVMEMRSVFPSDSVYPSDKIYPSVVPQTIIEKYQQVYPMADWYKRSTNCVQEYESIVKEHSLNGVELSTGLEGLESLQSCLASVSKGVSDALKQASRRG